MQKFRFFIVGAAVSIIGCCVALANAAESFEHPTCKVWVLLDPPTPLYKHMKKALESKGFRLYETDQNDKSEIPANEMYLRAETGALRGWPEWADKDCASRSGGTQYCNFHAKILTSGGRLVARVVGDTGEGLTPFYGWKFNGRIKSQIAEIKKC